MIEIAFIVAMLAAIVASLSATVFIVKMHKDMMASHKEVIELAMADRMAILDRVKAKQNERARSTPRETRKPKRPFAGEGNIRLRPVQADN